MTTSILPNIGLTAGFLPGEGEWSDPMNRMLRVVDALLQMRVVDKDLSTPPGTPAPGSVYIVGSAPTGAWVGQAKNLAIWQVGDDLASSWTFVVPKAGWKGYVIDEGADYIYSGTAWAVAAGSAAMSQVIPIACSDESTALSVGTSKVTFLLPFNFTLVGLAASLNTAPTGSVLTVDVNLAGTSILSTKLTIDATEKNTSTAATPAVISNVNLTAFSEITIDIDGVGSTVAGAGLKVYLVGVPA